MKKVVISGTGLFTPAQSISNDELVEAFNTWRSSLMLSTQQKLPVAQLKPSQSQAQPLLKKRRVLKSRFVIDKAGILDPQRMKPNIPERSNDEWGILCEMAMVAAKQALQRAGRTAADIDGVIVACSNLQRAYPAVAIEVQAALGMQGFAYDMNVACSSATFGIQAAVNTIQAGQAPRYFDG